MSSEREKQEFIDICYDFVDNEAFMKTAMKMDMIAYCLDDAGLEMHLRLYINQEGEAAEQACVELAEYTAALMDRIQRDIPEFESDDMQLILDGVRARIEGPSIE